jgi:hypothetical protein
MDYIDLVKLTSNGKTEWRVDRKKQSHSVKKNGVKDTLENMG